MYRRRGGSIVVSLTVALVAVVQSPRFSWAGQIGVVVPSYFYPGTGGPGGTGDGWAAMAAAAGQVPVTAVLNPNSGPLAGPADPSYVTAMTNLENAGGKVVAYVYTNNGSAPLATVESQVSTYITQYGSQINGFFLDGMYVTPGTLSYYQSLASYIKGLNASYTIIGNPGQPYLNGVSAANYLSTADVFNIFEGTNSGASGFNTFPFGQNWYQSYPPGRFSSIIYGTSTVSAMLADVSDAAQLDIGNVYVTDQTGSNPYAELPSYWDQEVSAIASVPEPSPAAFVLLLGSVVTLARRRRGRGPLPRFST